MENLKTWCVYCHTNKVNGKKYIGITGVKPSYRWNNGRGYAGCTKFNNAIKHYGWNAFQHDILFCGLTQSEAERLEIEMIAKHRTQEAKSGYNLASGGGVNRGWRMSEEAKKKIGEASKGHPVSPEARARISAGNTGNQNWKGKHHSDKTKALLSELRSGERNGMHGKKQTEEAKAKISLAMSGRTLSDETKRKIGEGKTGSKNYNSCGVLCVETGEIYGSMTEAGEAVGITKHGISKVCNGKAQTAGGYHWERIEAVRLSA